jgi:predicted phosphodiesterase
MTRDNVKNKRKRYNKRIREGTEVAPRRPEDYQPTDNAEDIARRLANAPVVGEKAVEAMLEAEDREKLHKELDKALDALPVDPSFVAGFRVSQWDGLTKDSDGEAQVHKLHGFQFNLVAESLQPKWDIIRRVESEPIPINTHEAKEKPGTWQREVILPDFQIGYRRYEDGTLDPFHDEKAIDVALQIVREVKPSRVILLGDFLDLPQFGRFEQTPQYAMTANAAIEYGHNLLRTIREIVPKATIVLLEGNHERRLEKQVQANLMAAFGIKRAGEKLPALSVPYLLALDDLGVEYVGAYPAGRYFINPNLMCVHGEIVRKGATSKAVTEHEGVSTIHGHTHRWESYARTTRTYDGARQTFAYSLGTLSRIDGAVPSVHGSTDAEGKVAINHEDWQTMVAVLDHDGKSHQLTPIFINSIGDYKARFEGKTYEPTKKRNCLLRGRMSR